MWTVIAKLPWVTPERPGLRGFNLLSPRAERRSGRLVRKRTSSNMPRRVR